MKITPCGRSLAACAWRRGCVPIDRGFVVVLNRRFSKGFLAASGVSSAEDKGMPRARIAGMKWPRLLPKIDVHSPSFQTGLEIATGAIFTAILLRWLAF